MPGFVQNNVNSTFLAIKKVFFFFIYNVTSPITSLEQFLDFQIILNLKCEGQQEGYKLLLLLLFWLGSLLGVNKRNDIY